MRDKIELQVADTELISQSSYSYILLLEDRLSERYLPVVIGDFEASAIISYRENYPPKRPLPYQLFKNLSEKMDFTIHEIIIDRFKEGVFYSILVCESNGEFFNLDSRTSDAVALSILYGCPIFTYESVMAEASISKSEIEAADAGMEETEQAEETEESDGLTIEDLQISLDNAILEEDYDEASRLRDLINKLKHNK